MKNKKIMWSFAVLMITLIIAVPCIFLVKDRLIDSGEQEVELYYMMANSKMKAVGRKVPVQVPSDAIANVLEALKVGDKNDGIQPTIPNTVVIQDIQIDGDVATIDFSKEYMSMGKGEEVICRASVVWSLTSLGFIEAAAITVDGRPLLSKTGENYGLMNRQNVLIDTVISATTTEYAILKLYFSNDDATDLVVEDRVVEVNANQPKERTILEQLIAGPKEEGNFATIPSESKIKDITTTADGVCYVNMNQEFVTKHSGGSTGELLTIYSIVNSLCELETVDKVQFLVEGEKLEVYKGHIDFSTPFVAVNSLNTVAVPVEKK